MLNLLFVVASGFPVPAIKGGAFETLSEMLSDVNEREHHADITIVSAFHSDAALAAKKYHYTSYKYIDIQKSKEQIILPDSIKKFLTKVSLKLFNHVCFINPIVTECFHAISDNDFDAVIIMGGNPLDFYKFARKFGKNKMYFNLGGEATGSKYLNSIYGKFLCCSQFIADELMENGQIPKNNVVELRNAIEYNLFSKTIMLNEKEQMVCNMKLESSKRRIIFWGRISKEKGVKQVVQAFIKMKHKDACELLIIGNARFGLGGESEYEQEVKDLAKDYKNILFTGFVHRTELTKILHMCDIAVLPSLWEEPAGNVVPEAMAAGLAVIITDSGGMVEYISENTGIIVARNENLVEELSKKMDELVKNDSLRKELGANAQQKAKAYDIEEYYARMMSVLKNDMKNREEDL